MIDSYVAKRSRKNVRVQKAKIVTSCLKINTTLSFFNFTQSGYFVIIILFL